MNLYVDDKRTPINKEWVIVRSYEEFVYFIEVNGLYNIDTISFDHDLGDINSEQEKTGMDCAKFLVNYSMDNNCNQYFPKIYVHSDNNVGSDNIIKYINNWFKFSKVNNKCKKVIVDYTIN